MVNTAAVASKPVSPNQLEKRAQIVEAAKRVLAQEGLAGCTARGVADASPLTKSAIHYYFADMDELIDLAMAGHIGAFTQAVRAAAQEHSKPADRFWAAVETYLSLFHSQPRAVVLWHEYWLHCLRLDELPRIEAMFGEVTEIFRDLLAEAGMDDPALRARVLTSYLIGAVTRLVATEHPVAVVQNEISVICPVG